jgi:soluble lytic murein transglycosylase-like protein
MPRAAERSTTQARKSTRGRRKKTAPPTLRERIARRMRRLWYAAFVFVVAVGVLDVLFLLGVTSPQQIRDAVLSPLRRTGSQFITDSSAPLASFYAPSVLYWEDSIQRWADEYGVNPNVIAIVMQIESCGDPEAVSSAGALGLMQVMPMHFTDGENMINPETNVRRGMGVFHECLSQFAEWDLGRALACYNGGPGVLSRSFENWPRETRSYYNWATGMWNEVVRGRDSSGTLDTWMSAGGSRLCQQALRRLSETSPLAYQVDGVNTE